MDGLAKLPNEILGIVFDFYADLELPIRVSTTFFRRKLCGPLCGIHPWVLASHRFKEIAERWIFTKSVTLDLDDFNTVTATCLLRDGAASVRFLLQNTRTVILRLPALEEWNSGMKRETASLLSSVFSTTHSLKNVVVDAASIESSLYSIRIPIKTFYADTFVDFCRFCDQNNIYTAGLPSGRLSGLLGTESVARRQLLVLAARVGSPSVVQHLLRDSDLRIDGKDDEGRTALSAATLNGHEDLVDILCTHKACPNTRDDEGLTPLMHAVVMGHPSITSRLLEISTLDVNASDTNGRTALMMAAVRGDRTVLRLLLGARDIKVNSQDLFRNSALVLAAREGHMDAVALLMEMEEVQVDSVNQHGRSALHYAVRGHHTQMLNHLLDSRRCKLVMDKNGNTPLHDAVRLNSQHAVTRILDHFHAYADAKNMTGITALEVARRSCRPGIIHQSMDTYPSSDHSE